MSPSGRGMWFILLIIIVFVLQSAYAIIHGVSRFFV